jgi:monofunctional biosynthetic peptidoglycan transglycosylase
MPISASVSMQNPSERQNWVIINDTVMGGRSQASLKHEKDYIVFSGELSMLNNGGFASTRRIYQPVVWQSNKTMHISIRGDGRDYQFRLRTNRFMDAVAYVKGFETIKDEWQTLSFNQEDFTPQFRGRLVRDAPALAFSNIVQIGFMLADGTPGNFELHIKEIVQK